MTNVDVYNNLNDEMKKYLDDVFSILDYLNSNEEIDEDNKFIYSIFLSSLKNDIVTSNYLDRFSINKDDYKDIIDNVEFKNANECISFNNINLFEIFKDLIDKLKYGYYLDGKDIYLNTILPYQIFDYTFEENSDKIKELINNKYNIDFDEIKSGISNYYYDYYFDFALSQGVNIDDEIKDEINSSYMFEFDNCSIYLDKNDAYITFNKNIDMKNLLYSVKSEKINDVDKFVDNLILPQTFKLLSINGILNINKETIENTILKFTRINEISLEIEGLFSEIVYLIKIDKYRTFSKGDEIVQEINVNEKDYTRDYTPNLDKYGFDLTKDEYIKDPCVGRDEELKRIEQILLYPERDKSIMVVGSAGSGKTALIKGLAYRIQKGNVPKALKNLRIISIDTSTLVAGTKYVGTLEEKMKNILDEASASKDIIIFIDEIHQALGGGKAEGNDNSVSEILKPYIDYGRVRLIGATTDYEYSEYVESDTAFKTRFKKVSINEPSDDIVYMVLDNLIESYNKLSEKDGIICPKLDVSEEEKEMLIKWLIESTKPSFRDYKDRSSNPRLVLDIIKEAYAIAAINEKDNVEIEDIEKALLLEERLYKSSRERQCELLKKLKPIKKKNNIIEFKLKKF